MDKEISEQLKTLTTLVNDLGDKIVSVEKNLKNEIALTKSELKEEITLTKRDVGVLIEHQNDKIAILAEQVADIPKLREEVRGMGVRLERVEGKVDGVANYLQNNLDPRVARLEGLVSEKEYAQ